MRQRPTSPDEPRSEGVSSRQLLLKALRRGRGSSSSSPTRLHPCCSGHPRGKQSCHGPRAGQGALSRSLPRASCSVSAGSELAAAAAAPSPLPVPHGLCFCCRAHPPVSRPPRGSTAGLLRLPRTCPSCSRWHTCAAGCDESAPSTQM